MMTYSALPAGHAVWITSGGYGVKIGTGGVLVNDEPETEGYQQVARAEVRLANGKVITVHRAAFVPLLPDEDRQPWMVSA